MHYSRKTVSYIKQFFSLSPRFVFHLSLVLVVVFISFSGAFASKKQTGNVIASKVLPVKNQVKGSYRTLATLASAVNSISGNNANQNIKIVPEPSLATTSETCLAKPSYIQTVISEKQREGIINYTTVPGDTLSALAVKFQISTSTIKWANGITDENSIKDGQGLIILPVSGVLHTVAAGENIDMIASSYGASPELTVKQNKLKDKTDIKEGQQIIVPDGKKPEPPAPAEPEPEPVQTNNYSRVAYNDYSDNYGWGGGGGSDGLMGSIGYARCGGNCVREPGVNNPGWGNPSDWPISSSTPWIGATAIWWYNHTGVVTGIWSNGDIEVRHQNYCGGQHRFSRSEFRGFR